VGTIECQGDQQEPASVWGTGEGRDISGVSKGLVLRIVPPMGTGESTRRLALLASGLFAEAKTRPRDLFLRKSPLAPPLALQIAGAQCAHSHLHVTKLLKLSRCPHKKSSVEDLM